MLQVSGLYIYPVKSLGGISLQSAELTDRGFKYDRRWMLVDQSNRFLSQREFAAMALIKMTLTDEGILASNPSGDCLLLRVDEYTTERAPVTIWDDVCEGCFVSGEADEWFSRSLQTPCRLVYMPDDSLRPVNPRYAPDDAVTSFSDAYPFLIIGQASLDDLNSRLETPVLMNRFRPNLVFTGGAPFMEDTLTSFSINNIEFSGVKLCARCPVPNIDQETGVSSKEPIKTLARYRTKNHKVMFGQNVIHHGLGTISIGDEIAVLELTTEERFIV